MAKLAEFLKAYSGAISEHERREPLPKGFAPPVVVSREIGSGGAVAAHLIGDKLDFQVCDKEILEEIARRSKVPKDLVELLDERPGRSLEIFGTCLMRGVSITRQDYLRCLKGTITAFLELGNCVILGRGAVFLAQPGKALRVRIIAPLEMRIANVVRYFNVSEKEARRKIAEIEAERAAFQKKLFGHSEASPGDFDIVLNRECLSISDAVDMALDAYRRIFPQARAQ